MGVAIDMIKVLVILSLLGVGYNGLPVPRTTGLVPGSAAEAEWYQPQLNGKMKRSPNDDDNSDEDDDDDDDDDDNDDKLNGKMKRSPNDDDNSDEDDDDNDDKLNDKLNGK